MRKVIGKYCVERKETKTLRCSLTPEELQEAGRALADTQIERAVLDAQKKDFMNQWKASSDELSAKQNRFANPYAPAPNIDALTAAWSKTTSLVWCR
jgi:hypothetical protein